MRTIRFEIEHATETVAQKAPRIDFGGSESSPNRSRTAPKCTPAHPCAPGIYQTRLKSLRSEPGHGFPRLLGHLLAPPSLPAQCPCSIIFHKQQAKSCLQRIGLRPPRTPRRGRRISWPEATFADLGKRRGRQETIAQRAPRIDFGDPDSFPKRSRTAPKAPRNAPGQLPDAPRRTLADLEISKQG